MLTKDLIWTFAGTVFVLLLLLFVFQAGVLTSVSGAIVFLAIGLFITLNRWYAPREKARQKKL